MKRFQIAIGGVIALAALMFSTATAHASVDAEKVCAVLDKYPNDSGVSTVVVMMIENGYTDERGADKLISWVQETCPEHIPALIHWAQTTAG